MIKTAYGPQGELFLNAVDVAAYLRAGGRHALDSAERILQTEPSMDEPLKRTVTLAAHMVHGHLVSMADYLDVQAIALSLPGPAQ